MIIKRQALANFIAKFTYADIAKVARTTDNAKAAKVVKALREKNSTPAKEDIEQWTLYVDDASNDTGSGADIMLISPKGHKIHYALRFRFKVYEPFIVGLHLAKELQARTTQIYNDSQLVVNQVNDIYLARGDRMVAYLEKAKGLMETFPIALIEVIPRSKNANVDALVKLILKNDLKLLDAVFVEFLAEPSIKPQP